MRSAPNGEGAVLSFAPAHYTRGEAGAPNTIAAPLTAEADKGDSEQIVVTFDERNVTSVTNRSNPQPGDPAGTLHDPSLMIVVPIDMRNATRTSAPSEQNRQGAGIGAPGDASPTLTGLFTPAVAVFVMASGQAHAEISADAVPALTGLHEAPIVFTQQRDAEYTELGVASTLSARDHKEATDIVIAPPITAGAHPGGANGMDAAEHAAAILAAEVAGTLDARLPAWGVQAAAAAAGHMPLASGRPRRLMPVECARLQGWPDSHMVVPDAKGKAPSDSAMYKAAGNGIASPQVAWIGFRLRAAIEALNRSQGAK